MNPGKTGGALVEVAAQSAPWVNSIYSGAWGERASYLLVRSRMPGWGWGRSRFWAQRSMLRLNGSENLSVPPPQSEVTFATTTLDAPLAVAQASPQWQPATQYGANLRDQ